MHGPLPNALDAEAAVISTMMLDPASIDRLRLHGFRGEHCYADGNRHIVETVFEMYEAGSVIDLVTLANRLRDKNRLEFVGGIGYLAQVSDATPAVANVLEHASVIIEKARLRKAIEICRLALARGYEPVENTQTFLEELEVSIAEVAHVGRRVELEPIGKVFVEQIELLSEQRRSGIGTLTIPTGFSEFDKLTGGGLYRGNVYIVGARPGMGKTAFLTTLVTGICRPKRLAGGAQRPSFAGALFSLEMPRRQMSARVATHETGVPMSEIMSGKVSIPNWPKLVDIGAVMRSWPIWINDSPSLGLGELRAMIRQLKRRIASGAVDEPSDGGIGVIAVDYLQLMKGVRHRGASREEEIASLSRGLKEIAKEEDVPLVVASQLNRNVEKSGKDKRPSLSDLRESGSIEQDADCVIFLYREAYYERETSRREAEVIIAKQRNGPTGTITMIYQAHEMRFYNLERTEEETGYHDDYSWVDNERS